MEFSWLREALFIKYSNKNSNITIEPLEITNSKILELLLERALIAETPIITKKYVISLTFIVSVLNRRMAKITNKPNAKPKSNFTLLNKKHNKNVIKPAEL